MIRDWELFDPLLAAVAETGLAAKTFEVIVVVALQIRLTTYGTFLEAFSQIRIVLQFGFNI